MHSPNFGLQEITALSLIYTRYSPPLDTHKCSQSSLVVSWQRIYNCFTVASNHKRSSSFHSLIPFLQFLLNHLGLPSQNSIQFVKMTTSNDLICPFITSRHGPHGKHHLYFVEKTCLLIHCLAINILLLHTLARARMCLPSRCVAMGTRHNTIEIAFLKLIE
jgi:hypothetical protein